MATRYVVRLEVTKQAKDKISQLSDTSGMTQVALTSRLVEWFATQPEIIQAAVLGKFPPEIQEDVAKMILKKMASGK